LFSEWKSLKSKLEVELERERKQRLEKDFLRFQFQELDEAKLDQMDFSALQNELDVLENAENIILGLNKATHFLSEDEMNVLSHVRESVKSLENLGKYTSAFQELTDRLRSVYIELGDIDSEIQIQAGMVESNPGKAEILRQNLDQINHLMHKHGVDDIEQLVAKRIQIEKSLNQMDQSSEEISKLQNQIAAIEKDVNSRSKELSSKRSSAIPQLVQKIEAGLKSLGMPNARVEIELIETESFTKFGKNRVEVKFSANKGFSAMPLEKVASGGERSRLMLVLKGILASLSSTPTLILDEIDTGISGEIAAKTAQMLAEMSKFSQIISITHLPQVAGKANNHMRVRKVVLEEKTETTLEVLSPEERKYEIARLLSGEEISEAALENAVQLMKI
jgi:DNA repair protein RecN (Recombination protein N)